MRVLATERLALHWLEAADAGFMLELVNDPDWLRYIGDRGIRSIEAAREYIVGGPREMYSRLGFGLYLVELGGTDTAVEICGLIKRDWLGIVSPGNHASRRLLARLGLQFERMVHPPLDADAVCLYGSARPGPTVEVPC